MNNTFVKELSINGRIKLVAIQLLEYVKRSKGLSSMCCFILSGEHQGQYNRYVRLIQTLVTLLKSVSCTLQTRDLIRVPQKNSKIKVLLLSL